MRAVEQQECLVGRGACCCCLFTEGRYVVLVVGCWKLKFMRPPPPSPSLPRLLRRCAAVKTTTPVYTRYGRLFYIIYHILQCGGLITVHIKLLSFLRHLLH